MVGTRASRRGDPPVHLNKNGQIERVTAKGYGGAGAASSTPSPPLPPPTTPPGPPSPTSSTSSFSSSSSSSSSSRLSSAPPSQVAMSPTPSSPAAPSPAASSPTPSRLATSAPLSTAPPSPNPPSPAARSCCSSRSSPSNSSSASGSSAPYSARRTPSPPQTPSTVSEEQPIGGPSDTPPFSILGNTGPEDNFWTHSNFNLRQYHSQSVSRQIYVWRVLSGIRTTSNFLISLLFMVGWRYIVYPFRMYFRQFWYMCHALAAYLFIKWYWLSEKENVDRVALIYPDWQTCFVVMWLVLHIWDLYRSIEYIVCNPRNIYPGWWADMTIRVCSLARPAARIAIVVFVALASLEPNMTVAEIYEIPLAMFMTSFTLGFLCGAVEIAIYWFVGFFTRRQRLAFPLDGDDLVLVIQNWEVKLVMPCSTIVAVWYAVAYFRIFVITALERGWWFDAGSTGYRGAGSGFWVPTKNIMPPRSTGYAW